MTPSEAKRKYESMTEEEVKAFLTQPHIAWRVPMLDKVLECPDYYRIQVYTALVHSDKTDEEYRNFKAGKLQIVCPVDTAKFQG